MTFDKDKVGDKDQRFEIAVLQLDDVSEIGFSDSPAGFNEAVQLAPRWRKGNDLCDIVVMIRDRKPEEGGLGMLLGLMRDTKVKAALLRAGCALPQLENTLRKAMKTEPKK